MPLIGVKTFRSPATDEEPYQLELARATEEEYVFTVLMDAARVCTLGQITEAFFQVGGAYRRNV